MEIKTWKPGMTDAESKDIGYWERNMLALYLADGWYNDDTLQHSVEPGELKGTLKIGIEQTWQPRFPGWRRVLSCFDGKACFHIPDDFDVLNLPQIARNWDGHSTEDKWRMMMGIIRVKWSGPNVTADDVLRFVSEQK